jgi:hypothetical protein
VDEAKAQVDKNLEAAIEPLEQITIEEFLEIVRNAENA